MKNFLVLLLIGTLFACSTSEDSDMQPPDDAENAESTLSVQKVYMYKGKQYTLDFILIGNEMKIVKDQKNYDLFSELLQKSNTIVYPINSGEYRIVFENEDEFHYYLENPSKYVEPILPGGGGGGNPSNPTGDVSIYVDSNFGGYEHKISSNIPNVQSLTMTNRISSIRISNNVNKVILYEDTYYRGNRIEITGSLAISCLCDYRINRSSVIYVPVTPEHPWDPDDWCGGGFTFGCNSWNDEISSIKLIYD